MSPLSGFKSTGDLLEHAANTGLKPVMINNTKTA